MSPTPAGNIHTTLSEVQGKRPIHGDSWATCGGEATVRFAGPSEGRFDARSGTTISSSCARLITNCGNRHSEPENAPAILLTAINLRLRGRYRPVPAGFSQVSARHGYIRIGRSGIQCLVHQIDIGRPALGCRRRGRSPGLLGCLREPRTRRGDYPEGGQNSNKSFYKTHTAEFPSSLW